MDELIKKRELLKALAISREHHSSSTRDTNLLLRAEMIVKEQPTMTEEDIRAEAIDEFLAKVKELFQYENSQNEIKQHQKLVIDFSEIDKIAEELKNPPLQTFLLNRTYP